MSEEDNKKSSSSGAAAGGDGGGEKEGKSLVQGLPALQTSGSSEKKEDFSKTADEVIPQCSEKAAAGNLDDAVQTLLGIEKKSRLAGDSATTVRCAEAIVQLSYRHGSLNTLCDNLQMLAKRRSQYSRVITAIVQKAMEYTEQYQNMADRVQLIDTLRNISEGKIYVEVERARLTKQLADIRESEGNIDEASRVLQEVQVETFGAMEKREKAQFLLEQMRLTLAQKDYIRMGMIANKVNKKSIQSKDMEDIKLTYYEHLVQYHTHSKDAYALFEDYYEMYKTKTVSKVAAKRRDYLSYAILYLLMAPFRTESQTSIKQLLQNKHVRDGLPIYHDFLVAFNTPEIIMWPLAENRKNTFSKHAIFVKDKENYWFDILRRRVIEHNIRIVAGYFKRVKIDRLCQLLFLDAQEVESSIARMVSDKEANQDPCARIYAKIDRPSSIVSFERPKPSTEILSEWSGDVSRLLHLVERTSHLIHRENMVHGIST
eukprot:gb/GECG01009236.1/.p1 GENE.gb/GECG01009236.1/~~gb/GECG01009236.1/.p1  ORF type:complete len:486 (+),score=69.75 gb/GECG01009236.1/:1-1458(+)